jgi:hypothetical protein
MMFDICDLDGWTCHTDPANEVMWIVVLGVMGAIILGKIWSR